LPSMSAYRTVLAVKDFARETRSRPRGRLRSLTAALRREGQGSGKSAGSDPEPVMNSQKSVSQCARGASLQLRDRAQARLDECGAQALSEVELLALVIPLNSDRPHELVSEWLARSGSLRNLINAERKAAITLGMNSLQYATLQAAVELARRHYQQLMATGDVLAHPRATREFLRMRLRDLPHEVFAVVYLDNRNRVIAFEQLFRGTINGAEVHPREVVKAALARNSAAIILAHNHPSGVAEPSAQDELITRRLKEALALVDIRVLDHVVIGDNTCESFAERGLL
jgi:DNA repair protein RadC